MVRLLGSFALALSLLLPFGGAGAQEQSIDSTADQSLVEEASQSPDDEAAEDSPGGALKRPREIVAGRPLPESWTEILQMRERLQAVKRRWDEIHWLDDNRRTWGRYASRRMAILTLEIEKNAGLDDIPQTRLHRAGQLLRWRLGQVIGLIDVEGSPTLDRMIRTVDFDLHNFYNHMPAGLLGPRGLPPAGEAGKPAEAVERPADGVQKAEE